jgi:hypothetical protein
MRKTIPTLFLICISLVVFAQGEIRNGVQKVTNNDFTLQLKKSDVSAQKTLSCTDTLRYPQLKEQIIGTESFYTFECWTADAEYISQAFILSGATVSITGIEFYGRDRPAGQASVTVEASIYNVNASYVPTTSLGSASLTISDTNYTYRQINFSTPISVTGNFAVVIRPTNTNGIVQFFLNDGAPGQVYDEGLSKYKSNFYPNSAGAWVSIPVLTTGDATNFPGNPFDFELLVAPKVNYSINTGFTVTPNPTCLGTQVNFTNTTTPTSVLTNRMFSWRAFRTYFNSYPDSTYAWDMDGISPLIWSTNASFTYSSAGAQVPELYTLGGLWASCLDSYAGSVTINPLPSVILNMPVTTVCSTDPAFALSGGSPAGGTYSGTGVSGGMFDPAIAGLGSHQITYTYSDGNCSNFNTQSILVDPCTGIAEGSGQEQLSLSPNPADHSLNISYLNTSGNPSVVQIFSAEGQLMFSEISAEQEYSRELDISSYAAGMYIIRVVTDNTSSHARFLKK